jgi:hypothetical protein
VFEGDAAPFAEPRFDFLGEVEGFAFAASRTFQFGDDELAQAFPAGEGLGDGVGVLLQFALRLQLGFDEDE